MRYRMESQSRIFLYSAGNNLDRGNDWAQLEEHCSNIHWLVVSVVEQLDAQLPRLVLLQQQAIETVLCMRSNKVGWGHQHSEVDPARGPKSELAMGIVVVFVVLAKCVDRTYPNRDQAEVHKSFCH